MARQAIISPDNPIQPSISTLRIFITCENCGRQFQVAEDMQGKRGKCPCGCSILIPTLFDYLVGQDELKTLLTSKIAFARANKCPLPHLLFCAPPASGKRTLATLTARFLGVPYQEVSAKAWRKPQDLLPYLTNVEVGSILIINDIDSLDGTVLDFFLPALNYRIDIVLGEGVNARTINLRLKDFAIIGTTARPSRIDKRLLHWLAVHDFKPYSRAEFDLIVGRMLRNVNLAASVDVARLIASFCGGSLDKASVIVKRIQNYLGKAEPPSILERIQGFFGEKDRQQTLLSFDSTKEILEWMGYKRNDLTSVEIACKIRSLSGEEFEEYVGTIFKAMGFAVEFTPVSGDHGIDLILQRGDQKAVVQCKRWEGSVGEPVVRDFLGSMTGMGVKDGFLITTGEFTAQAIEFGKQNNISLVDLDELLALGRKAGQT